MKKKKKRKMVRETGDDDGWKKRKKIRRRVPTSSSTFNLGKFSRYVLFEYYLFFEVCSPLEHVQSKRTLNPCPLPPYLFIYDSIDRPIYIFM